MALQRLLFGGALRSGTFRRPQVLCAVVQLELTSVSKDSAAMVPTPEEVPVRGARGEAGEEGRAAGERVVISGAAGLYPDAHDVPALAHILYNEINPVTAENPRWSYTHPEVRQHTGKVPNLQYFDAQFFKVHHRLGNNMDPMGRKILEQAYLAIYDAGISPEQLSGKKVGVYIGTCFSETEKACFYVATSRTGFGIAGCSKTMFANRISYWLNAKGPSMSVDQACCSSTAAVELGYQAILRGDCEAAIVGGTNLCLHPHSSVHYGRIMKLCKDGKTRSFDEHAEGCAKSEAINVLFLQKAKDALRVYAEIVHVKSEFSSLLEGEDGPRFGFYRSPEDMTRFLRQFYKEADVNPQEVQYVEACGSAVPEADKAELEALEAVFCAGRREPLLVGSVMSNVGYGEAASGITAITKVLLAYHTGELAANLHCAAPRRDVRALAEGRMRVVRAREPLRAAAYTAVNALAVSGVNAHVLLRACARPKDLTRYRSAIPHLVLVSGRHEAAVNKVLNDLKSRPVDPEELALLHNFHLTRIKGNLARGFTVLGQDESGQTVSTCERAEYFDYVKRPLWFVYSGMGSQWAGMGAPLLRIPVFAAAIERCRRALKPKGVDVVHIITTQDNTVFDNILNSFVGIAAIQIGLTDVLRELGLVPDKIIGHSLGEMGCAYADGCFTAEEMILAAYGRGLVSVQTPLIRGSMAAVGIGYQQIASMCPPEIEVACHNGPDSSTISGPADAMRDFVQELVAKNIYAKEVPCSNIAYHSRYIADAGPGLLKFLGEVIKNPRERSERWVSTSVPAERWGERSARYSSAEYHTNNLLSPVLFEESSRLVPADAVLVEVAPHALLQAILKRSLPATCTNVPLTRRAHPDNVAFFLEAVGALYMEGFNPNIQALYPEIEFPVSAGTPMLSHLVEWAHQEKWNLPLFRSADRKKAAAATFMVCLHDDEHGFLRAHRLRGKVVFPFAAALVAAWDALAAARGAARRRLAARLSDVQLHAQPPLHARRALRVSVALHRGTGRFEIMDDMNSKIASGYINVDEDSAKAKKDNEDDVEKVEEIEKVESKPLEVTSEEIYNIFSAKDMCYTDCFQSIESVNSSLDEARVRWDDNWVTFIDGLLQFNILRHSRDAYARPCFIKTMRIDPDEHDKVQEFPVTATVTNTENDTENVTTCGGVSMQDVKLCDVPLHPLDNLILRTRKFVPHFTSDEFDFETIVQVYFQIVSENVGGKKINVLGIYEHQDVLVTLHKIQGLLEGFKSAPACRWVQKSWILEEQDELSDVDLVLVSNLSSDDLICKKLYQVLKKNTFVVNIRECNRDRCGPSTWWQAVCGHTAGSSFLELLRWRPPGAPAGISITTVLSRADFPRVASTIASLPTRQELLILTKHPAIPGLSDVLDRFKDKPSCKIHLVMSDNEDFEGLNGHSLVNVDLAVNVFKNGVLGGEYYVPLQDVSVPMDDVALQATDVGQLDSVAWVQAAPQPPEDGIEVTVHYAALNSLDVKRATGLLPYDDRENDERGFGIDFSGITKSGQRVLGARVRGAARGRLRAAARLLWPAPAHWSLQDAATVPLAYCRAYYCLAHASNLYPDMRLLVHEGAGALGQALLALALAIGCDAYATVYDVYQKQFLLKMFPTLKAENIGYLHDTGFYDFIVNVAKRVDIVVCGVRGHVKNYSLNCLKHHGILLDVSVLPEKENDILGMNCLNKERTCKYVNFYSMFEEEDSATMERLQRLVAEGIARGWVRPLARAVYPPHAAPRALRLLRGAGFGSPLLALRPAVPEALRVQPRLQCSARAWHAVVGDAAGAAAQLARLLARRGARRLRVCSPAPPHLLHLTMRQLQSAGVQVSYEQISDSNGLSKLFNDNHSLEPTEGVYVCLSDKSRSYSESTRFVREIDVISRKLFPQLKYFAVINTVNSAGEDVCVSRLGDKLAATMITLPEPNELAEAEGGGVSARSAMLAVERALASGEAAVRAQASTSPPPPLLQQLAAAAEINIAENTESSTTLSELGVCAAKSNIIRVYLRDVHNVYLTVEEIQALTVQRINEMDETLTKTEFEDEEGLSALFTHVDADELLASTDVVFLPTLTNSSTMRHEEFNMSDTFLCVVPGVEGQHGRFRALCERLRLPALVLQAPLDRPHATFRELAQINVEILFKKSDLKSKFYLLGYESGVMVALEMAEILEDKGLTGTVFCVGAPEEVAAEARRQVRALGSERALQDALLRHVCALLAGRAPGAELDAALRGEREWDARATAAARAAARALAGRAAHSAQYARLHMEAARGRLARLLRHEEAAAPRALRSRLALLRPRAHRSLERGAAAALAALQRRSVQPVALVQLAAPLARAPEDPRCAAAVNRLLPADALAAYHASDRCDTYLLNADLFMTVEHDIL